MSGSERARVASALARLCPQWDLADLGRIEYLEGGYSNDNFALEHAGRRYVLRLPGLRQPYVDPEREAAWYGQLPRSVRVARPIALDPGSGEMLSPWIEGTLLVDDWPGAVHGEPLPDLARVAHLGAYLRQLHADLPATTSAYPLRDLMRAYVPGEGIAATLADVAPAHRQTCHNDLNPWNIIVTDDGWVTLDWEMVGTNDPLFDVVTIYEGLGLPRDGLLAFAMDVIGDVPVLEERVLQCLFAFWTREWGWAIFQRDRGNRRTEVLEQIDTASARLAELGDRA